MSAVSSSGVVGFSHNKCVASNKKCKMVQADMICELFDKTFNSDVVEIILGCLSPAEKNLCLRACELGIRWSLSEYRWDPRQGLNPSIYRWGLRPGLKPSDAPEILVEMMGRVVDDYAWRCSAYRKNLKLLDRGFGYANDWYLQLQEAKQPKRIEHFKELGVFFHGRPPQGFVAIDDPALPSGKKMFCYRLNSPTTPSEGLANVWTSLCALDCLGGIELAYYEMLGAIWGRARFDWIFRADGKTPLSFSTKLEETPLARYVTFKVLKKEEMGTLGKRAVKRGDAVHFANVPSYGIRHPQGEWQGFNVLCSKGAPSQAFLGFGGPAQRMTEQEVLENLAKAFNETTIRDEEIYTEALIKKLNATDKGYTRELPPGMTTEQLNQAVRAITMTAAQLTPENQAGFHKRMASPNIEAIATAMQIPI